MCKQPAKYVNRLDNKHKEVFCSHKCTARWYTLELIATITEEDIIMLDFLKDYQPEKVTDSFGIIKAVVNCVVNSAKIEEYDGDKDDWKGEKFFRYELECCAGQGFDKRKFWKSVWLADKNEKGVKKLSNAFFTIGLEFKDETELLAAAEKFAEMTLQVRAWGFKPKDADKDSDSIQVHVIKGIAEEAGTTDSEEIPF